jgi:estrone sulfotransferase
MVVARQVLSRSLYKLYDLSRPKSPDLFLPQETDFYLVSYPRSGNTWMRVTIAELLYQSSGDSLKELQYYVPDVHRVTFADQVISSHFHVIKSHHPFRIGSKDTKTYKNVIYIIRDPRDVVISYYKYLKGRGDYQADFDQFFSYWLNGKVWPGSWQEHVRSWTEANEKDLGINLHILRYEDLLQDTRNQVCNLATILNVQVDEHLITRVVEAASVKKMRSKEKQGMPEHESSKNLEFISVAASNQWNEQLSSEQLNLMHHYLGDDMKRYGYL